MDSEDDVRSAIAEEKHTRGDCGPMCSWCDAEAETVAGDSTPGPWEYSSGCVYAADGSRLAMMDREERGTRPVERDANARLMSQAPALLAAARNAERFLGTTGGTFAERLGVEAQLRRAIDAAEN